MGTPFGGNETPVAGTPTTTSRSVASSLIGRMHLPPLELRTQSSPNQSTARETDMAAVEGTRAQDPPGGASGGVNGNLTTDSLSFGSAPDSVQDPSIPNDFREDVHVLMEEEQEPKDEEPNIGTDVDVPTAAATFQNFLLIF
mmetsp:Transcript_12570/g.14419  ORF Transcript_12570/g.14419 Transcript_12570/m.14419 type:complete len:142 (-) Transcript_12570:349-774(-)